MEDVVVVTGAVGGIGLHIVKRLTEGYKHVVGIDLNESGLETASSMFPRFASVCGDIGDADVAAQVWDKVEQLGALVGLVNNTALFTPTSLHTDEPEAVLRVCNANLLPAIRASSLAVRWWLAHGRGGSIVNIGSLQAQRAIPTWVSYSMAKAALEALSRNISVEYGAAGIRANTLAPGTIRTPSYDTMLNDLRPETAMEQLARDESRHPAGRLGVPDDIAAATVFLLSEESSFISGATIPIDGGWTASAG